MDILDLIAFVLLLEMAGSQEVATPSSLLGPRNFNHHAYNAKFNNLLEAVPTRKGPVLFPNVAPSASKKPETVASKFKGTIRINGSSTDNVNIPTFLAPVSKYVPMVYRKLSDLGSGITPSPSTNIIDDYYDTAPYTDIVKKSITGFDLDSTYRTYEQSTSVPPIYNALSQHADRNLLNTQQRNPSYDYESQKQIQYEDNPSAEGNSENVEDKGYAFSYIVKDQKTGDDFSHSQRSSGSATNGEYRVRLPDGRVQIVSYVADENGYKADVRYDVDPASNSVEYSESRSPDQRQIEFTDSLRQIPDQQNQINQNVINQKYSFYQSNQKYNPTANQYNPNQFKQDYVNQEYSKPSKEYYDYSAEYDSNRTPYKSKFAELYSSKLDYIGDFSSTTSQPSYDLGEILAKALPNVRPTLYSYSGTQSATTNPISNVRSTYYDNFSGNGDVSATSNPLSDNPLDSFVASTPNSYLVSTIDSLRDRASAKPILSDSFISRINKYLSFK